MKISKVLLRWYKSFNVNYAGYADRQTQTIGRPWNVSPGSTEQSDDYQYIEIPVESDITTIVGANESGKSHLLSAINCVLLGHGLPGTDGQSRDFERRDLCHFAIVKSKNADVWPNVGLTFDNISSTEAVQLAKLLGVEQDRFTEGFSLILGASAKDVAEVYFGSEEKPKSVRQTKLAKIREILPTVRFIQSDLAMQDEVYIDDLIAKLGEKVAGDLPKTYAFGLAQDATAVLEEMTRSDPRTLTQAEVEDWQNRIRSSPPPVSGEAALEAILFRDILRIDVETLKYVANQSDSDRSHVDGIVSEWNLELARTLNLSRHWQQDDQFALRMNYKARRIYFEITDKTEVTYTFRDRSSGLRYFLSYYIQAKALEQATTDGNCVIVMDEPDSFLSVLGQRNLLAVFESLVAADTSRQHSQLVYTTHSPFLINRNFPQRIRLLRKGDAEEGTQLVGDSRLRRYEPIRSALGVECAQTLFMGATNIVFEGPTDQYIITELIRYFGTPDNVSEFLDLNALTLVSADGAPGVAKLLESSQWGDEPNPATVVFLDADGAAIDCKKRILGETRGKSKLISEECVVLLTDLGIDGTVLTIEDLIPRTMYFRATLEYVRKWYPAAWEEKSEALEAALGPGSSATDAGKGMVEIVGKVLDEHVHPGKRTPDKMGILECVVQSISASTGDEQRVLEKRVRLACHQIRQAVGAAEHAVTSRTGKQAIRRVVKNLFIQYRISVPTTILRRTLDRLGLEASALGVDGSSFRETLTFWDKELANVENAGQTRITDSQWENWRARLNRASKNPLRVSPVAGEQPQDVEPAKEELKQS